MNVLVVFSRGGVTGGHVIQPTKTAEALESLGVQVTVTDDVDVDCRGYDVVHAFGASRDTLRRARSAGAAIAISPIWWSADYRQGSLSRWLQPIRLAERAVRITHSIARRGFDETARRVREPLREKALQFEFADILLPNSELEAKQIRQDLGITTPTHVVPNAIDETVFTPPDSTVPRAGVACVGRIEPHKNQLGLIRELRGTGIPLTIAGPEHPHHRVYAERCRRTADRAVTFLPGGTQEIVRDIYRSATVHALPSWFETTGLASLEAAATGCAITTTTLGYAEEYFGDQACYCDPRVKGSIRSSVIEALERGPSPSLRERVLDRYTWRHAAEATLAGYRAALTFRTTERRT